MSLLLMCAAVLAIPVGETGPVTARVDVETVSDSEVTFTFLTGDLSYGSFAGRWYPVIAGMGLRVQEDQPVLPEMTLFVPVPPGSEPEISSSVIQYRTAASAGPALIGPVQQGTGLETEWIPAERAAIPFASEHADVKVMRIAGIPMAVVTIHPMLPGSEHRYAGELRVSLAWEPSPGGRPLDDPILSALCVPGALYWREEPERRSSPFWGSPWARIAIEDTGPYTVSGQDLEAAGCQVVGTPSASLRMWTGPGTQFVLDDPGQEHQLNELAFEVRDGGDGVFDSSDSLFFFGLALERLVVPPGLSGIERLHHRYATHNVYWLTWGAGSGLRVDTLDASPDGSQEWGASLAHHLWQEHDYLWLPKRNLETGWVWSMLFENIPGYFYFSTPSTDGPGSLTISLASSSYSGHHTLFQLNNELVLDTTWYGSTAIDIEIPDLEFEASMNLLKITTLDDPGNVYINATHTAYPRLLSYAADRALRFPAASGRFTFDLGGAGSQHALLDITDPYGITRLTGRLTGTDLSASLDVSEGSMLWLEGTAPAAAPDSIAPASPGRIIGTGIEGDVAIVVADVLLDEAAPLEDIYARRGLSTAVVALSEVYEEFGQGVNDPGAIRSFFRYTQDSWSEPARELLLVGDGTYDPLLHVTSRRTLIPAFIKLGYDNDGRNRDDYYVIAHDGGELPEAPVSRIPALTPSELNAYLSKVDSYGSDLPSGQWTNRIILAADDEWGSSSVNETAHTEACEILADSILPKSLDRVKFYLIDYPWPPGTTPEGEHPQKPESREDIVEELAMGCSNMIFFGHGSYDQIAHEKLMVSSDVLRIPNEGRQPVMMFASCDVGHFDMISANSMAEEFTLQPGSGSIATIAATRGTMAPSNTLLFSSYFSELYGAAEPDIATTLWLAKMANASGYDYNAYNIVLGDGGVRPVFPDDEGSTLQVDGDTLFRGRMNGMELSFPHGTSSFVNVTESGRWMEYNCLGGKVIEYLHYGSSVYMGFITGDDSSLEVEFFIPLPADTGYYSRCSGVGLSALPTESAWDEWVAIVDRGGYVVDTIPPMVEAWIAGYRDSENPEVSGTVILRAAASDESGINTMGGGAGRSILMSLDSQGFDLSGYFSYLPNSHTHGELDYTLPDLAEGPHRVIVAVWDGMGNSSRDTLDFSVTANSLAPLSSVFVYPNPAAGPRCFSFMTSTPGTVEVTVYTVTGRAVWRSTDQCDEGYNQVMWDGRDADGDELATGSYIYSLVFSGSGGSTGEVTDILAVVRELE